MSLADRQSRLLDDCIDSVKNWKNLINTHLTGDEMKTTYDQLMEVTKKYCSANLDIRKSDNALRSIEEHLNSSENNETPNVETIFKDLVSQDGTDPNHFNSEIWKTVFSTNDVEEVQEQREELNEGSFQELSDSISVQASQVFTLPVDPMTKKHITDPYRNRLCGHVYEYNLILQYIKSMKNRAKCPYVGCGNRHLQVSDLVKDEELQRKIVEYSQQNDDSSSD